MMKKALAVMLSAAMAVSVAPAANVAEAATVADTIDCPGWWQVHSGSIEVTTEGVAYTFKNTTYADASNNWNAPIYVFYTADEEFSGEGAISETPGYTEYSVTRSDAWGWTGAGNMIDFNQVASEFPEGDAFAWENWVEDNHAGQDYTVSAIRLEDKVYLKVDAGDVITYSVTEITQPDKPVYLSLGGEACTLSGIQPTTFEDFEKPEIFGAPLTMKCPIALTTEGTKEVYGKVTAVGAEVTVSINGGDAIKATTKETTYTDAASMKNVPATEFTAKLSKALVAGDKVTVTATAEGYATLTQEYTVAKAAKKAIKISKVAAKKGTKKVTGTVSASKATVKVTVGKKTVTAKVSGKKFTATLKTALKKGDKVTVKATASGYKAASTSVKVK